MNNQQMKRWIDDASYEQLLSKWRNAPIGDSFFLDEMGEYYALVMKNKKEQLGDYKHVEISKNIGWKVNGE